MIGFRILCDELSFERLESALEGYFPADIPLCVELILVDDCSKDNSCEMIEEYLSRGENP